MTSALNGRHVLAAIVGFFLVVIAVNVLFITLAVRTFPGEMEKHSYVQGLHFNSELARRAAQRKLGWSAAIDEARVENGNAVVVLSFRHQSTPLSSLSVDGLLERPTSDSEDLNLTFAPLGDGRYRASAGPAKRGLWLLKAKAKGTAGEDFRFETRIVMP